MDSFDLLLFKNVFIGWLWGFITWLFDIARGKSVSFIQALTKVVAWWFVSYFLTPVLSEFLMISDQWFISAILGILWYKIIEYATSGEFFEWLKMYFIQSRTPKK